MRIRLLAAFTMIWLAGILPAADPQLVALVMPDAKVLAGVNADLVKASPFGQFALTQGPFADPKFQQLVLATGFDPTRDIHEILFATTGDPGQHAGLALARGQFSIQQISDAVKAHGATVDNYKGVPMFTSPEGTVSFAFLSSTLAIAGDPDNVTAAIDRRSSSGKPDAALLAKANQLSLTEDAWVVSTAPLPKGPAPGQLPGGLNLGPLSNLQQSSGGVKFGAVVQLTGEAVAQTAQDASSLADVVRLFSSLAQANHTGPASQFASLLQSLVVQTQGNTLRLSIAIPEDQFEQLIPPQPKGPRKLRRVSR
jgi:hypothetical protein